MSFCEGGLLAEGMGFEQGRATCFFATVDPMNIPVLPPRLEESNQYASLRIKTGKIAQHSLLVRSKARAGHSNGMLGKQLQAPSRCTYQS